MIISLESIASSIGNLCLFAGFLQNRVERHRRRCFNEDPPRVLQDNGDVGGHRDE